MYGCTVFRRFPCSFTEPPILIAKGPERQFCLCARRQRFALQHLFPLWLEHQVTPRPFLKHGIALPLPLAVSLPSPVSGVSGSILCSLSLAVELLRCLGAGDDDERAHHRFLSACVFLFLFFLATPLSFIYPRTSLPIIAVPKAATPVLESARTSQSSLL